MGCYNIKADFESGKDMIRECFCELYHTLKGVIFSLPCPDLLLSISSAIEVLNSMSVISRCSVGTKFYD